MPANSAVLRLGLAPVVPAAVLLTLFLSTGPLLGGPVYVPNVPEGGGWVQWHDAYTNVPFQDGRYVGDNAPGKQGTNPGVLKFYWTDGYAGDNKAGHPLADYGAFTYSNSNQQPADFRFVLPKDARITDWTQEVTSGVGRNRKSNVTSGNIRQGSPWAYYPLADLPDVYFRIPDLAPFEADDQTIYTAVNLGLYLEKNPFGFLGGAWQTSQTLSELNVSVVNGQIQYLVNGLTRTVEGLYLATTDFNFDPNSATGYVPSGGDSALLNSDAYEDLYGDIGILAEHRETPEPATLFLAGGAIVVVAFRRLTKRPAG